jgi:hypothetical protein
MSAIHDVMQRVAAEQRHEPRRAGGDHGPLGVVGVEDAQRAEVLGAAGDDLAQGSWSVATGSWARHRSRRSTGVGPLDRLTALVAGLDLLAVDDRRDLDARRPRAAGGHDHLEGDHVAVTFGPLAERHVDAAPGGALAR